MPRVPERGAVGEQAHADEPFLVERQAREPVGVERGEHVARLGRRLELRRDLRQHAAEDRVRRVLDHRAPHELLDLPDPALLAPEHVQLEPVRDGRVPALGALAEPVRLVDPPLGLSANRPSRSASSARYSVTSQSCAGWRSSRASCAIASSSARAASRSPSSTSASSRSSCPSRTRSSSPARAARSISSFASSSCRAVVVGRVVAEDVAVDRVGERRARPPRRRAIASASSLRRGLALGREARVAERAAGEPREQPHPQRALVGLVDGPSARSSSGTRRAIVPGDLPHDPPAVAERRAGELLGQRVAPRPAPPPRGTRRLGRGACRRPRDAASPSASSSSQRASGVADERQRQLVVARRLLVGELARARGRRRGGRSRSPSLAEPAGAAATKWCASSARCGSRSAA